MNTVSRVKSTKELHKKFANIVELYAILQKKLIKYLPKSKQETEELIMDRINSVNQYQQQFLQYISMNPINNPNVTNYIIMDVEFYVILLVGFFRVMSYYIGDNKYPPYGNMNSSDTNTINNLKLLKLNKLSKKEYKKIYKLFYKIIRDSFEYLYYVLSLAPIKLTIQQKLDMISLFNTYLYNLIQYFKNLHEYKYVKKLEHLTKKLINDISNL